MLRSAADATAALSAPRSSGEPDDRGDTPARARRTDPSASDTVEPDGAFESDGAVGSHGADSRPRRRPAGRRGGARRGAYRDAAPPEDPQAQQPAGDPENAARVICLRLLDQRARSRAELADALTRRGLPDEPARRVLDRLTEVGLIDDAALAGSMASAQHRERGLARRAVAVRLRKRGFDDETVGAALESIDADDERARAHALVTKRQRALAALPTEVQARRLVGLLARKGYPAGLAYEVVRAELAELAAGDALD